MGQSGASVALPRVRARRRFKRPRTDQVYWLALFVVLLGWIAHAVVELLRGGLIWAFFVVLWIGAYLLWWQRYQERRRAEESQDLAPKRIERGDWLFVGSQAAIQAMMWLELIRGVA